MSKEMTLFARYKNMINNKWAEGSRNYTAGELNKFVGAFENSTAWKRWNNNPFYSTRCYQTALKQLGCITKIKRGLWRINAPIPEWFGSFHLSAFINDGSLAELERSSTYWKSLPAEHKVNPFVHKPAASGIEATHTEDAWYEISLLPDLLTQFRAQINIVSDYNKDEAEHEIICTRFVIGENETITEDIAKGIMNACGKTFDGEMSIAKQKALENARYNIAILQVQQEMLAQEVSTEKHYTEAQVKEMLNAHTKEIHLKLCETLLEEAEDLLRDHIDLEWDSFSRTMDISIDEYSAKQRIKALITDVCEEMMQK